jgi:hypothetical protein
MQRSLTGSWVVALMMFVPELYSQARASGSSRRAITIALLLLKLVTALLLLLAEHIFTLNALIFFSLPPAIPLQMLQQSVHAVVA